MNNLATRRDFLATTTTAAAAGAVPPYWFWSQNTMAQESKSPNERPRVGCIGNGGQGR